MEKTTQKLNNIIKDLEYINEHLTSDNFGEPESLIWCVSGEIEALIDYIKEIK